MSGFQGFGGLSLSAPTTVVETPGLGGTDGTTISDYFNKLLKAQDFDKAYRTIHWSNPSYTVCPKTTSALKTLVEHHGFSSDEWVAEVKRDSKGVITWRFHWGTPTSYLDTKIRLTKAITRMVELGRLLTKDELRECTVGSRQHVMKRRMDGCGAPHTPPKPRRVPLAPRLVAVGPPAREPIYDSDEDQILSAQQDGCMRRVGSQMIRYHLDRGPRPDKEQLGVMRKEFVNKKILMRTSINRIGMCDGFLCADIKIGNELLRARKWLEIQDRFLLDTEGDAMAHLASSQQGLVQSLRADLDAAEATRDAALASEAAATRAAKELQCRVDALLLEASAKGDSGPMTQDEASQLREEVKRLKGIEQKYEQFKNLFSS